MPENQMPTPNRSFEPTALGRTWTPTFSSASVVGVRIFVSRRSHEIGIRLALGATRRTIVWLVVREAAVLTLVGGALGLAGYVAASRAVGAFLFGLSATDPPTVAAAAIVLAAIALSAGFIPAWRAVHLEPAHTLRDE